MVTQVRGTYQVIVSHMKLICPNALLTAIPVRVCQKITFLYQSNDLLFASG